MLLRHGGDSQSGANKNRQGIKSSYIDNGMGIAKFLPIHVPTDYF